MIIAFSLDIYVDFVLYEMKNSKIIEKRASITKDGKKSDEL